MLPFLLSVSAFEENDGEALDDDLDQDTLSEEQMHGLHRRMDADGDGKTSVKEILAFAADMRKRIAASDVGAVMEEMDRNKDGVLNFDELMKDIDEWDEEDADDRHASESRKALEKEKFVAADLNGDGHLALEELPGLFYPETNARVMELVTKATMLDKDSNGDGQLTPEEFWGTDGAAEDLAVTEEEAIDFRRLDADGSGRLDLQELGVWESGDFHTEEAMQKLFQLADQDNDMHVTAHELGVARETITGSDAQYHLLEWAEHFEL